MNLISSPILAKSPSESLVTSTGSGSGAIQVVTISYISIASTCKVSKSLFANVVFIPSTIVSS